MILSMGARKSIWNIVQTVLIFKDERVVSKANFKDRVLLKILKEIWSSIIFSPNSLEVDGHQTSI